MTPEQLAEIKSRAQAAAPGHLQLCQHLTSPAKDASCSCGYRGAIFTSDGGQMVCEMGSTITPGEEGLEAARMPREVELATAHFFANANPDVLELVAEVERLNAALGQLSERVFERLDWLRARMDGIAMEEGDE
jgi:hypothetical protein